MDELRRVLNEIHAGDDDVMVTDLSHGWQCFETTITITQEEVQRRFNNETVPKIEHILTASFGFGPLGES